MKQLFIALAWAWYYWWKEKVFRIKPKNQISQVISYKTIKA